MATITGAFFNPTRNLKPLNITQTPRPTTLSESNALYSKIWKQHYHFLIGTCNCTYNNNDPTDMLNVDTFFSLSLSLALFFLKIGTVDELTHAEEQVFSSNIGLLHYLNISVPLVLCVELGFIKLFERSTDKLRDEQLRIGLITTVAIFTAPLLMVGLVTQACYTLIALVIAATLVTLTSSVWYPLALAQTENNDNMYKNQIDEDVYLSDLSI